MSGSEARTPGMTSKEICLLFKAQKQVLKMSDSTSSDLQYMEIFNGTLHGCKKWRCSSRVHCE